jgi:hypothetical protein
VEQFVSRDPDICLDGMGIAKQRTGRDANTGIPVGEAAFHVSLYQN